MGKCKSIGVPMAVANVFTVLAPERAQCIHDMYPGFYENEAHADPS